MKRFLPLFQVCLALLLFAIASAALVNGIFLATRPETISVVNSFIGLGVMVVAMTALATILFRKGLRELRQSDQGQASDQTSHGTSPDSK